MKRLLAIICVLVMVLSLVLASCGGGDDTSAPASSNASAGTESSVNSGADTSSAASEESSTALADPYRDENGNYVNKNKAEFREDWKDREVFRVLVYSNKVQTTYFSEEIESMYETTDDKIREAVDTRNKELWQNH